MNIQQAGIGGELTSADRLHSRPGNLQPEQDMSTTQTHNATYAEMLQHPKWKAKRASVLARDAHQCRNCGTRGNLQVHHRQYHRHKATGYKLAPWCYPDRYLITLCDACHYQGHQQFTVPSHLI